MDVVIFLCNTTCTKTPFLVLRAITKLFLFWTGARMGGSRGLPTAPEITQTPWEEQSQQGQLMTFGYAYMKIKGHSYKKQNRGRCEHISVILKAHKRVDRWLIIISAIVVFHRNPNLSDERDLERLRFLPPDDDLERLRFCLLSGEEEGERDLFRGEEPFPDLELDLLEE